MNKAGAVIIFTVLVLAMVTGVVFTKGNTPQQMTNRTINQTQTAATANLTILPPKNSSVISLNQLATHNIKTNCWVGYNTSVYDITDWLPRHPGSSAAIEPYCGTAAEFEAAFKGQHGQSQVKRLTQEGTYKGSLQ